ncbi:MAG: lytic transglycosylase domain-containing protein [Candidatus Caldatribacterium sp.]|uniref:lytic transglycosylase domain-containing protein n=1 Tax=Candidatus Caldatribacterium sp. TaxID=2282143 RepID=UPI00299B1E0C|nr:lytic transglycosylase domain-containing protein [Candidatus Caldatribacterium sp.]MCX7730440.1 lytic transglycosylase domain-containing protein [Candidatus Caldatribacterium sp.]MDW8080995.1 lytic transglycosylase domain-containing protein [Candidatus Calescibacterium sp.]
MFGNVARVLARIREIEERFGCRVPERVQRPTEPSSSFEEIIEECARKYGISPALVRKLIAVESGGNPKAVSPKGAVGLMQLMPETCKDLGISDPFDVRQNIEGGVRYLRGLLDRFGSLELALAAYNAGPARVKAYGGIPPFAETQAFIRKVLEG